MNQFVSCPRLRSLKAVGQWALATLSPGCGRAPGAGTSGDGRPETLALKWPKFENN